MTTDDEVWDDHFHGCALAAFIDQAIESGGPPDIELTRRHAFVYYEKELVRESQQGRSSPSVAL
jgi:hypothetical protein